MFRNPTTDLIVVLVIVLLIFGPKRLPGLGKSLGTGMREFKDSITGESKDEDEEPGHLAGNSEPVPTPPVQQAPPQPVPIQQAPPQQVPASRHRLAGAAADRGSAEVGSERNS